MKHESIKIALVVALAVAPCGAASIIFDVSPGVDPPPATLGGYTMQAFPTDIRSPFTTVQDVPFWNGDTMGLTTAASLRFIGSGWSTWSHGYGGAVYFSTGTEQGLVFPANINAFYMYVEPSEFDVFEFTFSAGGESASLMIDGDGGAQYVGVYTDDINVFLDEMSIVQPDGQAGGFAIGEFGANVPPVSGIPEPGSVVALGCVLASGLLLRSRRSKA